MPFLTDLIAQSGVSATLVSAADVMVRGITQDSRNVKSGDLFAAIKGTHSDGTQFIEAAAKSGAVGVMAQRGAVANWPIHIAHVVVENDRLALAKMAAALYPGQPQHMVAVTGTNGKTSVAEFYRQIMTLHGNPAASLGTLGLKVSGADVALDYPTGNTSPDAVLLHQTLAALCAANVQHVAIEASSHGLDQYRLDGAHFESAAFTNLTHDHLDYHANMEEYFAAKSRLFLELPLRSNNVWINADDDYGKRLMTLCADTGKTVQDYGISAQTMKLISAAPTANGMTLSMQYDGEKAQASLPLFGAFQAHNICAATGLAITSGLTLHDAAKTWPMLQGVRGRMEHVATLANGANVFVDYAHTPDALQTVLMQLRAHCTGKLHVVFGCGGDRDTTKRPIMGRVAAHYADHVIVTDDNPRSENPSTIRAAIMAQAVGAIEIGDREHAIAHAIKNLNAQDVLIVAGKGHETYQIIGSQTHHFDDAEVIRKEAAL